MSDQMSLAEALEKQKEEQARQRRRRVRAFANRLRLIGFGAMLTGVLVTMGVQSWGRAQGQIWLGYVMAGVLLCTWLYSGGLLLRFWWRTGLTAHILEAHWTWLAVLVGIPVDLVQVLYFRAWFPVTLALIVAGSIFWRWRSTRARREGQSEASRWDKLVSLSWNDLILMRFPCVRRGPPAEG